MIWGQSVCLTGEKWNEECYVQHLEFLGVKEDVNPTNSNK